MKVNEGRKPPFPDLASWIRFTLRDYIPKAYGNYQRYLRTGFVGNLKVPLKMTPLKEDVYEEPVDPDGHLMGILIGKRQYQLLKALIPFENAIQSFQQSMVQYRHVPDFIKARVTNDILQVHQTLISVELEEEEKILTGEAEKPIPKP